MTTDSQTNYVEQVRSELAKLLPTCDPALLDLYTLLALEFGVDTDLVMVHNAWAVWKNRTDPQHRSLIPFPFLTPEVQELDRKYMDAIHQAVAAAHEQRIAEQVAQACPNCAPGYDCERGIYTPGGAQ